MIIRSLVVLTLLAGAGCAEFPDLSRDIPASELDGPYPPLAPLPDLLARTEDPRIEDGDDAALTARAAALRARAARLRSQ